MGIIEINNITFGYTKKHPIYQNFSVKLGLHPCEGLVGPNGAGKSTLVKLLLGLEKPWQGNIITPSDIVMGFLPETPTLPAELTTGEFLIDMAISGGVPKTEAYKLTDILLIHLHLEEYRDSKLKTLSKGTLQRVVFAQAIIHGPSYVILDEPTSGLDPISRKHMLSLIKKITALGVKVLMSTHILTDIKQVCQRVISIENGHIISDIEIKNLIKPHMYIVETDNPDVLLKHLEGQKLSHTAAIVKTENPQRILEIIASHNMPLWKLEPYEEDIYEVVTGE